MLHTQVLNALLAAATFSAGVGASSGATPARGDAPNTVHKPKKVVGRTPGSPIGGVVRASKRSFGGARPVPVKPASKPTPKPVIAKPKQALHVPAARANKHASKPVIATSPPIDPKSFASERCSHYSAARLASIDAASGLNCTWYCIASALYCHERQISGFVAQRVLARGQVWEGECKQVLRQRYRIGGQDVGVAGLFSGDWLPPLSAAVGGGGRVFGFEPTVPAVNVSQAVVDANSLTNVRVQRSCLSDKPTDVQMCVDHALGYGLGDRAHISRSGEDEPAKGCRLENLTCTTLDRSLPWRERRVGLLLLDVEGHEEPALWGAANLTREWRPLIASEVMLHGAKHSPVGRLPPLPVWKSLLEPLGYVPDGECPGLRFYRALASQLRQRDW